jgi:phosphatidylglycerophosphatase A
LAGFVLFRLFDIWKPGPIDRAQSLHKGWGVTMDDVLAGLLTGAILGGVYSGLQ